MDALVFRIDAHRYAVPLGQVLEVLPAVEVRSLPDAPPLLAGVVNVRGEIVPVLALRARLGHPPREVRASDAFVLARAGSRLVVLPCDGVPGIVALPDAAGEPSTTLERTLAGVLPLADGVVLLRDLDAFLSASEERELDAARARAREVA